MIRSNNVQQDDEDNEENERKQRMENYYNKLGMDMLNRRI